MSRDRPRTNEQPSRAGSTSRGRYLDIERWGRRAQFAFFAPYELPFFNVCTELRVGPTLRYCREHGLSSSLACWFACLRTINALEPFRMRLRPPADADANADTNADTRPADSALPRVWIHERIDIGTTVLNDDGETFRFCYFPYAERFDAFCAGAKAAMARAPQDAMEEREDDDDLIHGTTVPWIRFSSVSHPRRLGGLDAVPKIVFGRYDHRGDESWLPVSIEVHHMLMDGLHVGRAFERLERELGAPETTLGG